MKKYLVIAAVAVVALAVVNRIEPAKKLVNG